MTTRDFVATVYIVKDNKVLLVHHKKLGMWLPPGGHIDKDELPEETAVRETKEETGLDIEIVGRRSYGEMRKDKQRVVPLMMPEFVQLEDIEEGHQHIDLLYIANLKGGNIIKNEKEVHDIRWFSLQDLDSEEITDAVREQAKTAIEKIRNL